MNYNFSNPYSNATSRWNLPNSSNGNPPQLNAPNFSGFSAASDKPFLPLFGVPASRSAVNGDLNVCNRKRRCDHMSNDMESRQRKVFISEERMVNRLSRLNLDQGPDLLQDLAPDEGDSLLDEANAAEGADSKTYRFESTKNRDSSEVNGSEIEFDDSENMGSSKVVLSDTLKDFVDRKTAILPEEVLERITQQHKPVSLSRELVLWRPPGEQIREAIRKSLRSKGDDEDENPFETDISPSAAVTSTTSPLHAPLQYPRPLENDSACLDFDYAEQSEQRAENGQSVVLTSSYLPDLVMDQPSNLLSSGDTFRRAGAVSNAYLMPNANWPFEQMET